MPNPNDRPLDQLVRVTVVDANRQPLPGAVVETYLYDTNVHVSTAKTASGPVTIQVNTPTHLKIVAKYEGESIEQSVAAGEYDVTIPFPNVRLVTAAERWAFLGVGVLFVLLIVVLASVFPEAKGLAQFTYRAVLALGAGLIFTGVSGFLKADLKLGQGVVITAGGSAAAFVLIFLVNPPTLG